MAKRWSSLKKTKYAGVRVDESGRYVLQARVRQERTGRIMERTVTMVEGTSIEEALAERARLVRDVRKGTLPEQVPAETMTLSDYAKLWLVRKLGEGLREHTIDRYRDALTLHILPVLGNLLIEKMSPRDILVWRDFSAAKLMRNGKPYSRWTINSWNTVLRSMLTDATVEFELPRNPCHGVRGIRKPKSPRAMRRLNVKQMQKFLRLVKVQCPQHYGMGLLMSIYGLRWEEASALHQKHVDVDNLELHVVQAQVRRKLYPTKNENHKSLPLHPEVIEAIEQERERLGVEENPGLQKGLLFPATNGDYRLPSSVRKSWSKVSKAMGLDFDVTPHDLRRSYQNLLRQASVNMVVQQALMGHSSDAMTAHYSHVEMAEKRAAQEKVIDLLEFREKKEKSG